MKPSFEDYAMSAVLVLVGLSFVFFTVAFTIVVLRGG